MYARWLLPSRNKPLNGRRQRGTALIDRGHQANDLGDYQMSNLVWPADNPRLRNM